MNSTLLRFLAVILALGAIATAFIGYRLSSKQGAPVAPPPPVTYPQVVAARDIPAGRLVTAEDVMLSALPQRDAHAYDTTSKVMGKLTLQAIPSGTVLLSSHFPVLGPVAQTLHAGERGVAIKVNEVIGAGGFVSPGDHVDVLLYIRGEKETGDISSSQVVLRDARVLAFGDDIGQADEAGINIKKTLPGKDGKLADKEDKKQQDTKKGKASRSAILAVPEKDAARLMLADSAGQVRLSLRGAEPPQTPAPHEDTSHYLRLAEMANPGVAMPLKTAVTDKPKIRTVLKKTAKPAGKKEDTAQVIVHKGDQVEVVSVRQ